MNNNAIIAAHQINQGMFKITKKGDAKVDDEQAGESQRGRCFFLKNEGRIVSSNCIPDMPAEPVAGWIVDSIKNVNSFSRQRRLFVSQTWHYCDKLAVSISSQLQVTSSRQSWRIFLRNFVYSSATNRLGRLVLK